MSRYVITGCAASGTKWASELMTRLGSRCGHQRVFRVLGKQPWKHFEGDSSFFAVGQIPDGLPVMRVMRDPLAVVRSLDQMSRFLTRDTKDDALTYDYIGRHRPDVVQADDRLGRILRYVATWDDIPTDLTLYVDRDDSETVADAYEALTGRRPARNPLDVMFRLGKNTNTHNGPNSTITWQDIEAHPDGGPVIEKAVQHAYAVDLRYEGGQLSDTGFTEVLTTAPEPVTVAPEAPNPVDAPHPGDGASQRPHSDGLDDLTIPKLTDIARQRGIHIKKDTRKADIIAALRGK